MSDTASSATPTPTTSPTTATVALTPPAQGPSQTHTSWAPKRQWLANPTRWLGGPVFTKEVWTLGKRLSTSWIRFVYGGLLLGLLFIVVFESMDSYLFNHNAGNLQALQAYQQIAPAVTIAVLGFQFGMLPLMGCVLGGSAVCEEIRAGSLGTLLSTPLRAWQVVMGKLLGRCTELLILSLLALPVLLMARVLGGVSADTLIAPTALCAANALLALQISIWMSARAKHAAGAMAGAIGLLVLLWVIPAVLTYAVVELAPSYLKGLNPGVVSALCPPLVFVNALSKVGGFGPAPLPFVHWGWSIAWSLLLTVLFFALSTKSVRRAMFATAVLGPGAGRTTKKKKPQDRKRAVSIEPDDTQTQAPSETPAHTAPSNDASEPAARARQATPKKRTKSNVVEGYSRTVGDNPVLWREFQQRMTRGQWATPVAIGVCVNAMLFLYWMSSLKDAITISLAMIGVVVLLLLASLQTAGAISSEREGRTLDVLLTTPISARGILWGKLLGAAKRLSPLWIAIVLHLIFSGFMPALTRYIFLSLDAFVRFARAFHPTLAERSDLLPEHLDGRYTGGGWAPATLDPVAIVAVLCVLACTVFMQLATGLLLSTLMRRTTPATICNLLLWVGAWAFLPIALAVIDNDYVQFYAALHPIMIMGSLIDNGTNASVLTATFPFPDHSSSAAVFFGFAIAYCCIASVAGLLALKVASLELGFAGGRRR
jgi:ABC-type transport system involved in multi-copper enzyme maturation permease subunit